MQTVSSINVILDYYNNERNPGICHFSGKTSFVSDPKVACFFVQPNNRTVD